MKTGRRSCERAFTLIELLVVITILALLVAILLPALGAAVAYALQVQCSTNLHNLGLALQQYGNENEGRLPRLARADDKPWRYIGYDARNDLNATASNNQSTVRALYTCLVRGGYTTPDSFICPATANTAVPDTELTTFFDFPDSRHISYSYQNNWVFTPTQKKREDFPIMADRNPQFKFEDAGANGDKAVFNDDLNSANYREKYCSDRDRSIKESANSLNHGGRGQNVLYAGSHVRWCTRPVAGVSLGGVVDNIYTRHDDDNSATALREYGEPIGDGEGNVADSTWKAGSSDEMDTWLVP